MNGPARSVPRPGHEGGLAVLVISGQRLVAESVACMLPQLDVVARAESSISMAAAGRALETRHVDVVLASELIHGEPALRLLEGITSDGRLPATIVLAAASDPRRTARALRRGAAGWIDEECRLSELAEALATVRRGGRWVTPRLRAQVIDALLEHEIAGIDIGDSVRLSPRQREVLACLMDGRSHGEVAESLQLALNTVRTHVRHMCRLAEVHSTPALVALARSGAFGMAQDLGDRPR